MSMRLAGAALTVLVGLVACAPVISGRPITPPDVAGRLEIEDDSLEDDEAPPSVVVRTFTGSPYVNVLAWAGDESRFGLRSSVREDGELARGFHSFFMGAETVRQLALKFGGDWSVFPFGGGQGRVFAISGGFRDVHSCEGNHGCTPFNVVTVRIEDDLLRRSATTGLDVRVHGRTANLRSVVTLSPAVVAAYLTTFDSVATARRTVAQRQH